MNACVQNVKGGSLASATGETTIDTPSRNIRTY